LYQEQQLKPAAKPLIKKESKTWFKLLASKKKIIYEIIRNRKSIKKQRDKLTSYFKLAKN
jgi:hypothetical protein